MSKICSIYNQNTGLGSALYSLYISSKRIQLELPESNFIRTHSPDRYSKEWATIQMKGSRQTGNTNAIGELCNYLDMNWLILSNTVDSVRITAQTCRKMSKDNVISFHTEEMTTKYLHLFFGPIDSVNSYRGVKLKGIIVDNASLCGWLKLETIYSLAPAMANYPTEHFILVG